MQVDDTAIKRRLMKELVNLRKVAKRLYAQEKREGSAVDRTRADREETQARSKEQRATLNRAGSMRRRPPAPNAFQERAAMASAGLPTSFTSR
jgi:hypothetical protein